MVNWFPEYIVDKTVYPIVICGGGREYLALYCYTKSDDALIGDGKNVLCFHDETEIRRFCEDAGLTIEWIPGKYDFDEPIENPIRYSKVLDRWNLLNTIAGMFGMYFAGNERKYDGLYDLLFRCSTSAVEIAERVYLNEKHIRQLQKIFCKKGRFLKRFKRCRQ